MTGQFLKISTPAWLILSIAAAILHQFYVWFCWRTELYYSLITRLFGKNRFTYYSIGFVVLSASRFVFLIGLAVANRNSLAANQTLLNTIAFITLVSALYVLYSVARYFTFARAFGADHFDESYRDKPLVRKGIFRWTRNGMYNFGFPVFWAPGLLLASKAALLAALFSHLYIWVHYYCVELPDMKRIYRDKIEGDGVPLVS
ncbi:MAG: hypothetical protein JSU92_04450 [Deltaproteobacteria bacterium]|nr:MAG: hypothetical protein JSU92_04450 [Deltaproteobacteria bacterium]